MRFNTDAPIYISTGECEVLNTRIKHICMVSKQWRRGNSFVTKKSPVSLFFGSSNGRMKLLSDG